jgi:hypothetical protein
VAVAIIQIQKPNEQTRFEESNSICRKMVGISSALLVDGAWKPRGPTSVGRKDGILNFRGQNVE